MAKYRSLGDQFGADTVPTEGADPKPDKTGFFDRTNVAN